jgi:hypothetical protein
LDIVAFLSGFHSVNNQVYEKKGETKSCAVGDVASFQAKRTANVYIAPSEGCEGEKVTSIE